MLCIFNEKGISFGSCIVNITGFCPLQVGVEGHIQFARVTHTERVGNYFRTTAFQNVLVAKGVLSRWQVTAVRVWIIGGDMRGKAVVLGAVLAKCQFSHQNIQVHWPGIEIGLLIKKTKSDNDVFRTNGC